MRAALHAANAPEVASRSCKVEEEVSECVGHCHCQHPI